MAFLLDFFSSPFDQPVGATADLKELEYISALLQTGHSLRSEGSITVEDVARYLLSRHGIRVTPEYINQTIFQVFGIDEEKECELLDLVELTAMLVIPILIIMQHELGHAEDKSSTTLKSKQQEQKMLLEDPKAILTKVLSMMFQDSKIPISPTDEAPRLSTELIQEMLKSYGMHFLADNEYFIGQMLHAAQGQTFGANNTKLDEVAFIQALTGDVKIFSNEGNAVEDLLKWNSSPYSKNHDETDEEKGECLTSSVPWQQVFTANPIDFTADTYPSVLFVVCIWLCFIFFFIAYFANLQTVEICNPDKPGCYIANSIVSWLAIAVVLMLTGILFIGVGNIGFLKCSNPFGFGLLGVLGMATVVFFTILFFTLQDFNLYYFSATTKHLEFAIARYATLCLGCLLILLQIAHVIPIERHLLRDYIESSNIAQRLINGASMCKIAKMFQNAHNLHSDWSKEREIGGSNTCFGRALIQFSKQSQMCKKFSLTRSWLHVFNGKLIKEEGLWLSSRLLSGVLIQLCAVWWICTWFSMRIESLKESFTTSQSCTLSHLNDILSNCSYHSLGACVATCINDTGTFWIRKFFCQINCKLSCDPCSLVFPLWSIKFAQITSLSIVGGSFCIQAINYIPSYIKTTLKFRYGLHPSLRDPNFEEYRLLASLVGSLIGSTYFGVVASGYCILWLVFYILLFFVAPLFREAVIKIFISFASFTIIVTVKACLMVLFRSKCFNGFYRRRPAVANIVGLMFECWNFVLAIGFIFIRAIKLMFTSVFYIGRIDVPMLQIYGRVRPWNVDFLPMIFRADILAHEAHRHPYIETIGLVCLYKLRYKEFANTSGSTWRALFVMTLFPWLRKYSYRRKCNDTECTTDNSFMNKDEQASSSSSRNDVKFQMEKRQLERN